MRVYKYLMILIIVVVFSGCGSVAKLHRDFAKDYTVAIEAEKELAREFYEYRWDFYSGILDVAIAFNPGDVPSNIIMAHKILIGIPPGNELSDRDLGRISMLRAYMLSAGFEALMRRIGPMLGF